ncbi:hypothetical protein [Piscibacillus salipiscarius]|uniref:hypothetical protein n=1 Tax=Piscibacillus salipiscarius TaxID=299480 RepID=UPI000B239FE4
MLNELQQEVTANGLIFLIPFVIVLVLALIGHHLLTSLTWGIVASIALFFVVGIPFTEVIHIYEGEGGAVVEGALMGGLSGYFNMAILILFILSASYLLELAGTMDRIMDFFIKIIKGVTRRAELSIFAIVAFLNSFITINTAAEIAAAPFVSRIGKNSNLHPYRRANFLDTVSSALVHIPVEWWCVISLYNS